MKSVVRFSIKQTVFINVLFLILVVIGLFSLFTTPVENMPIVDMGNVFIRTVYFGASSEDVEQLVTSEIEDALDGLKDVEYIQSQSHRNFSSITVKLIDDSDYEYLYDEIRFRVLNIRDELPPEVDEPTFTYVDTYIWMPVVMVHITGDLSPNSLKQYAEELRGRFLAVPDVREVEIEGEHEKEFHISIDPHKLRKLGVTFQQVTNAVQSANTKIPTGRFRQEESEYMLDAGTRVKTQEDVLNIVVRRDGDGNFIRVADLVTHARLHFRDPTVISSVNGENSIRLNVTKEKTGNSIDISAALQQIGNEFKERHEMDGIDIVYTHDSTIEINDSVNTLSGNLILGLSLVMIVLWVTLGFRNAMLTSIGIPFSFLCAVTIMKFSNLSINTLSLFSFVLVTGIMVDDAVIIVENIFRHLQMGKPKKEAIVDGTSEVMQPVIASAVTTVLAFLPMLIMTGSTGDFFAVIPKTVTYALIASLLEALFVLPVHVLDWGPTQSDDATKSEETTDPFHHVRSGIFAPLWNVYRKTVEILLNHKMLTLGSVFGLIFVTTMILVLSVAGIMPLMKVEFFPGNYFRYHVSIVMPVGTSIEKTDAVVRDISSFIMSLGEDQAQSASGSAGYHQDEDYSMHFGDNYGEIVVTLPDEADLKFPENPDDDPVRHLDFMRNAIKNHVANNYTDGEPVPEIKVFGESDGPPTGKPVNIRVTAMTQEDAAKAADTILAFLESDPEFTGLADLGDDRPELHKTYKFIPKQEKAFEYGLQPGDVTRLVAGTLNGQYVGQFRTPDEEVDMLVRLSRKGDPANTKGAGLDNPLDILEVPLIEDSVSPVLLKDTVKVQFRYEPTVLARYKGRPTITITSDIKSGSTLSAARIQYRVEQFFRQEEEAFPGVALSYGGEFESTRRSYISLTFAFFIALLGIYTVLASQFKDYFQPLIIISAVPFALIGVVVGLLVTRTTFTVGSFLAVVGLAGLVVNDSLLLVDFMNVRRRAGKPLREAIILACATRMRPVIITTVTTALGLLPMAIGIPSRSLSWAPMATAFVAGLSSATILALLIIPVEYELLEKIRTFFKDRRRR